MLVLNAKREMGQNREQEGRGEEAGLRSYLDSQAVTSTVQSRGFKGFLFPYIQARIGHTHKVGMHYSSGVTCSVLLIRSLCTVGPSFPKSSLLSKLSKQTGWEPPPFTSAAREPRVLTGKQALAAEGFCSQRHGECYQPEFQPPPPPQPVCAELSSNKGLVSLWSKRIHDHFFSLLGDCLLPAVLSIL